MAFSGPHEYVFWLVTNADFHPYTNKIKDYFEAIKAAELESSQRNGELVYVLQMVAYAKLKPPIPIQLVEVDHVE